MAQGYEVLQMLIPTGGWAIRGNDWEGVGFYEAEPITKKQFEEGFAKYDKWKAETDLAQSNAKTALLKKLGITEDEAKLLLG